MAIEYATKTEVCCLYFFVVQTIKSLSPALKNNFVNKKAFLVEMENTSLLIADTKLCQFRWHQSLSGNCCNTIFAVPLNMPQKQE
jgi:hypothetical protein